MIRKAILILGLLSLSSAVQMQSLLCSGFVDSACIATLAFSANTVHHIRTGGYGYPGVHEAIWHKTEPILIVQSRSSLYDERPKNLHVIRLDRPDGSVTYTSNKLFKGEPVTKLALVGDAIIVGTYYGSLMIWDVTEEKFMNEFPVSTGEVTELLIHPTDGWLLVVIDYGKLYRFDLRLQAATEIHLQSDENLELKTITFSEDGLLLAAAGNGTVRVWDTEHWEAGEPADISAGSPSDLLFADDDSQILILDDESISRWSLVGTGLHYEGELSSHPAMRRCQLTEGDISPDGSLLMTTDSCSQYRAWDLTKYQEIFIPKLADRTSFDVWRGTAIQFSSDGRYLAVGDLSFWGLLFVLQSEFSQ